MTPTPARQQRRRGSVYVAVLGFATLLLVSAVAALTASSVERKSVTLTNERIEARLLAMSAADSALLVAAGRPSNAWRAELVNESLKAPVPLGKGYLSIEVYDPVDGDPADNQTDPFYLIGVGTFGDAEYRLRVELDSQGRAIPGTWERPTG